MWSGLPRPVRALVCVRVLNQLGAYVMPFLAVIAGPGLATEALAVFGAAALASRWLGGLLLDRLAPRTLIVAGLAATGAALLLLAAAHGPVQVMGAVALLGLMFEVYEPATQESLARLTAKDQRNEVYGLLGTYLVAAGAVAGLLAALLLPLGARWLAVVDAGTCLVAAVVAFVFLEHERVERDAARRARWRPSGTLVRLTLAGTAFACGYLAVLMFTPLLLLERGAPEWLPGVMLTCAAVLTPLTGRLGRRRVDGLAHGRVLALGTGVLGVLALAMAAGRAVWFLVAAYVAWAVVDSVLQGRWQVAVAEAAPEAERPRWFAFFGSSWGVAQPAVPVLVAATGAAMATAGAAFLLVPALLAVRAGRRHQRVEERPGGERRDGGGGIHAGDPGGGARAAPPPEGGVRGRPACP